MTQAPTPGPLDRESVKLLVKGDLLRVTCKTLIGEPSLRIPKGTAVEFEVSEHGLVGVQGDFWSHSVFVFIGRPDADGWMPWSGGESPVPGRIVEAKLRDGPVVEPRLSDDLTWQHGAGFYTDIIAFRLAPTAPVEASGSEREGEPTEAMIQAGLKVDFDNEDERATIINVWQAMSALRPQPSGETREAVARIIFPESERVKMDKEWAGNRKYSRGFWNEALTKADDILALIQSRPFLPNWKNGPSARPAPVASGGQHSCGEGGAPRKVSAFPVEGDPVQQMTGLTVSEALDDPASSLEIMRALTTSRTLCVWADGTYRVMPTMDVPTARNEEGTLIGVIPMAEIGEVHEAPVAETAGEASAHDAHTFLIEFANALTGATLEQRIGHLQSFSARLRAIATPPVPADKLRIAVEALESAELALSFILSPSDPETMKADTIRCEKAQQECEQALAALKSTAAQEGGEA